jgi:hypothetical protein
MRMCHVRCMTIEIITRHVYQRRRSAFHEMLTSDNALTLKMGAAGQSDRRISAIGSCQCCTLSTLVATWGKEVSNDTFCANVLCKARLSSIRRLYIRIICAWISKHFHHSATSSCNIIRAGSGTALATQWDGVCQGGRMLMIVCKESILAALLCRAVPRCGRPGPPDTQISSQSARLVNSAQGSAVGSHNPQHHPCKDAWQPQHVDLPI